MRCLRRAPACLAAAAALPPPPSPFLPSQRALLPPPPSPPRADLGDNTLAALPVSRGFDASLGFWSGGQDYLTHWDVNSGGYDMMENTTIRGDLNNTWTTEIFAQHAVDTISRFSPASDARLFLYLAFQNVHWPLMAPQAYVDRFAHTTGNNTARQLVCAMAAFLDDGIANVTAALKRAGIYDNTLIIVTSDNGGPVSLAFFFPSPSPPLTPFAQHQRAPLS